MIAYAVDYPDLDFRLARFVDKILKGAKTAKTLCLTIPQAVLLHADEALQ